MYEQHGIILCGYVRPQQQQVGPCACSEVALISPTGGAEPFWRDPSGRAGHCSGQIRQAHLFYASDALTDEEAELVGQSEYHEGYGLQVVWCGGVLRWWPGNIDRICCSARSLNRACPSTRLAWSCRPRGARARRMWRAPPAPRCSLVRAAIKGRAHQQRTSAGRRLKNRSLWVRDGQLACPAHTHQAPRTLHFQGDLGAQGCPR